MLAQLTISNFAIVRELEIDFQPGMTAITGETGAGKSIAIDALGLCLGNRADGNVVRLGAARADICARFAGGHPVRARVAGTEPAGRQQRMPAAQGDQRRWPFARLYQRHRRACRSSCASWGNA